jgi:hypothetical protein
MSTQQTQKFNLMEAIVNVASGIPDTLMTIHNVHTRLYEKYKTEMSVSSRRDDTIRELKKAFREIEKEFDNIYRVFRSNGEYLIWSLEPRDEILLDLDSFQTYEDYLRNGIQSKTSVFQNESIEYRRVFPNIEVELQLPKEKTVLERITDMVNVRDLTFIHDPTTVDGILTAIQYLIKMNKVDLLRRINDLSSVSFSGQTVRGETCIQLAMETGNCQMVEFILSANYEKQIRILHNQIDSLKMTQVSLYEDKRKSTDHIKLLKEECDSTRLNRILNKMKTYFIIFLIILMFIF